MKRHLAIETRALPKISTGLLFLLAVFFIWKILCPQWTPHQLRTSPQEMNLPSTGLLNHEMAFWESAQGQDLFAAPLAKTTEGTEAEFPWELVTIEPIPFRFQWEGELRAPDGAHKLLIYDDQEQSSHLVASGDRLENGRFIVEEKSANGQGRVCVTDTLSAQCTHLSLYETIFTEAQRAILRHKETSQKTILTLNNPSCQDEKQTYKLTEICHVKKQITMQGSNGKRCTLSLAP